MSLYPAAFQKRTKLHSFAKMFISNMALLVMKFQDQGYKIRKIFA